MCRRTARKLRREGSGIEARHVAEVLAGMTQEPAIGLPAIDAADAEAAGAKPTATKPTAIKPAGARTGAHR